MSYGDSGPGKIDWADIFGVIVGFWFVLIMFAFAALLLVATYDVIRDIL